MLLWQYVLAADRERDLTDPSAALEFIRGQPADPRWAFSSSPQGWDLEYDKVAEDWAIGVRALRSLARRLKRVRSTRAPDIDPLAADDVLDKYVGKLRPRVHRHDPGKGGMTAKGCGGIRLAPTLTPAIHSGFSNQRQEVDYFLQRVFGSLLVPDIEPVCKGCGADLPPTGSGRPSRRNTCKRCQWKAWWARKGPKARRDIWNAAYKKRMKAED
jgi:hypothetical protein